MKIVRKCNGKPSDLCYDCEYAVIDWIKDFNIPVFICCKRYQNICEEIEVASV